MLNHAVDAHGGFDECECGDAMEVDVARGVFGVLRAERDKRFAFVGLADILYHDVVVAVNIIRKEVHFAI